MTKWCIGLHEASITELQEKFARRWESKNSPRMRRVNSSAQYGTGEGRFCRGFVIHSGGEISTVMPNSQLQRRIGRNSLLPITMRKNDPARPLNSAPIAGSSRHYWNARLLSPVRQVPSPRPYILSTSPRNDH